MSLTVYMGVGIVDASEIKMQQGLGNKRNCQNELIGLFTVYLSFLARLIGDVVTSFRLVASDQSPGFSSSLGRLSFR